MIPANPLQEVPPARVRVQLLRPDETWEYLHAHRPFRGPRDILRCLKKSKLRQKCYDSLPLFTNVLSDAQVPALGSGD